MKDVASDRHTICDIIASVNTLSPDLLNAAMKKYVIKGRYEATCKAGQMMTPV